MYRCRALPALDSRSTRPGDAPGYSRFLRLRTCGTVVRNRSVPGHLRDGYSSAGKAGTGTCTF